MAKSIKHITNFKEYRELSSTSPCIVKFTAEWCGPCRRVGPTFTKLAMEHNGKINFLEIDIDKAEPEITNFEDVKSIPLFVFYHESERMNDLRIQGVNEDALVANVKYFVEKISIVGSVTLPRAEVIVVPVVQSEESQTKKLNMSRLALDDANDSDSDLDPDELINEEPQYESDEAKNEYGEECDIPIEKTIPEDMIREDA